MTILARQLDPPYLHGDTLDTLVELLADDAARTDVDGLFPEAAFGWLAEAGLLAVALPGQAIVTNQPNTAQLLLLLKRIGGGNLAVGRVYEGHINALQLVARYGTAAQQKTWFADVTDHHRLFSVWNTQANDGVHIHAVGGGRYRLSGSKTFCSGANWIDRPLVTGELHDGDRRGWQMCIIPTDRVKPLVADDRFWQPLGMRASVSFRMDFTGIELSEDDLLGKPGDYYQQPYFSGGAIRFAAVQLGGAEAIFDQTRLYLSGLQRTDDAFQQARLAEMTYLVESGNQWLQAAGQKTDAWQEQGGATEQIVAYANMTRTAIEEICLRVMQLAGQCVGARGLMRPLPFERLHRDLTFYLRQPAPDATRLAIGQYVLNRRTPGHALWNETNTPND